MTMPGWSSVHEPPLDPGDAGYFFPARVYENHCRRRFPAAHGGNYYCTRREGHEGPHAAHRRGASGAQLASWEGEAGSSGPMRKAGETEDQCWNPWGGLNCERPKGHPGDHATFKDGGSGLVQSWPNDQPAGSQPPASEDFPTPSLVEALEEMRISTALYEAARGRLERALREAEALVRQAKTSLGVPVSSARAPEAPPPRRCEFEFTGTAMRCALESGHEGHHQASVLRFP